MQLCVTIRDCEAPEELVEMLDRVLRLALGRFHDRVPRVEVVLEQSGLAAEDSPEHRCRIRATITSVGTVKADAVDRECRNAAARAVEQLARRIRTELTCRTDGIFPGVVG